MQKSIFDKILQDRELRNEKKVAVVRFVFLAIISVMDTLSFFKWIHYTEITPTITTITLDLFFLLFSITIMLILIKNIYFPFLKFIILTLDCMFLSVMLAIDPTVQKDSQILPWETFVAALFLYFLNLLRYSREGSIYAGFLSFGMFLGINHVFEFGVGINNNLIPMAVSLLMFLGIGHTVTESYKKLMTEANTKKMMERYLPPQLIQVLYNQNFVSSQKGIHQEVTILFSDIRSFTTISESMSPQEVVDMLNQYLTNMTEVIFANQGTIDKFIGDAIMTIFGAPIKKADDATSAVRTAIEMMFALKKFNDRFSLPKPLEIGIGIHTGEVVVGNIGSEKRLDYTVIGDNVNLTSRIESLTKHYQCPILISESTYSQLQFSKIQTNAIFREVDTVIVKGKTKSIQILEVMCFSNTEEKNKKEWIKTNFESGLNLYKNNHFLEAISIFEKLSEDHLSQIYANRCKEKLQNES